MKLEGKVMRAVSLGELVAETPGARLAHGDPTLRVSQVTHDSRAVQPGGLFVALPGRTHDGVGFVADAVRRGAVAVASEAEPAAWARGLRGAAGQAAGAGEEELAAA